MKKITACVVGFACALVITMGILLLIPLKSLAIVMAVVIICLSLCFGLLTFQPISAFGLVIGICMLFIPSEVLGIVWLCLGSGGAIINLCSWKKLY